jgi:hypothetical protein
MKFFFLIFILTATFFISCKKNVTELPPATQTGANTFGAKVDGSFWVPQGFGIVPTAPLLEATYLPNRDFYLYARNFSSSPTETEFEFLLKGARTTGTYLLNTDVGYPSTAANYGYYVQRRVTPLNEWVTSSQYTGSVILTRVDTIAHIVSGTFQFNALNLYNAPQPISVTEGRFDVVYQ